MDMAATDTTASTARGRLSPPLLPRLLLSPDTDTAMDMGTDTVTGTVTAVAMDTAATDTMASTARGRLSLPLLLRLLPSPDMATTAVDMATDTATVMATDTAMDTATMDREGTDC